MDACIASSISHRTAYILNTLNHMEEARSKLGRVEYGTFEGWDYGRSRHDTASFSSLDTYSSLDHSTSDNVGLRGTSQDARGACRTAAMRSKSSIGTSQPSSERSRHEIYQACMPTSEGSGGGVGEDGTSCGRFPSNNLPHYDTFYSPKSYQPVRMFNLNSNKSKENLISSRSNTRSKGGDTSSCVSTSSSGIDSCSSCKGYYNDLRGFSSPYSSENLSVTWAEDQPSEMSTKKAKTNKKVDSAMNRKTALKKDCGGTTKGIVVKKGVLKNPDVNNNFYKGGCAIFFDNRKRMPGHCDFDETKGKHRINQLAMPKTYPCQEHKKIPRDHYGRRASAVVSMERINALAQPKLCHFTVCSCCLSPNCLGECSTRVTKKRSGNLDPDDVDWDRLATPRKKYPPNYKLINGVKSSSLKAKCSKRVKVLAAPLERNRTLLRRRGSED